MRKLYLPFLTIFLVGCFSLRSQSNLWGVTSGGGNGSGTIFGLSTGSTALSSTFNMSDYSGGTPVGVKLLEANGKLYGMTSSGGAYGNGVLFQYDPVLNAYTVLIAFSGSIGSTPGSQPSGPLMTLSSNTNKLYGMTKLGGANNQGVIFTYDIPTATYSVLASFTGTTGAVLGSQPWGSLLQGSDGKLYGITNRGGTGTAGTGSGVIFSLDPTNNTYTALVSLTGSTGAAPGSASQGSLIEGTTGKLHGLTQTGGSSNTGTMFEYNISGGTYSVLVNFTGTTTGTSPAGSLTKASNGKLYGMTLSSGTGGGGVLFEFDLTSYTFAKDMDMVSGTGSSSACQPLQASNGKLYGITRIGGANNLGVIFEYDITGATYTKKIDLALATGSQPQSSLMQFSGNGKLYGVTAAGGSASGGVIFEYDITSNTYTKKVDLNTSTGGQPSGGLVLASNNKMYGMTPEGGSSGAGGVLYEYDQVNNIYAKKADLTTTTGRFAYGAMVQATNNILYGLTSSGGTNSVGTLFQYTAGSTSITKLVDLATATGAAPYGTMVQASNGKLYGLTSAGGANGVGVIFEYDITANTYTDKYDFAAASGASPFGSLFIATNGKAYGVTSAGGANGVGVIFEYDITTNTYTKKIDLTVSGGSVPYGSLVQANGNFLYGMTRQGGSAGFGALFEYDFVNVVYTKKVDFTGTNGSMPYGSMIKAANGLLYGMTTAGGTNSVGVMFEYNPATVTYTKKMDLSSTTGNSPGYTQLTEICTFPGSGGSVVSSTTAQCQGDASVKNFSIATISNATSYTWTVPSGATVTSGGSTNNLNVNFSGLAAGVYTLTAAGVNVCGNGNLSSISLTVNALPTIGVNSGTICSGTSFTINPSGASSYTIAGGSSVVSPTNSTNYTVTGVDANGCVAASPATSSVTVSASPNVSVTSGSVCIGGSYTMTPSGASTYTFSSGSSVVTPASVGASTYSVVGTGANGCVSTGSAVSTVTAYGLPVIGVNSGSICSGSNFVFLPNGAFTYSITGNNFIVSPTITASYSVTGTSTAGCISASPAVATLTVYTTPTIAVSGGSICSGRSFTFNPTGLSSGTYNATGGTLTVTPASTTGYTVTGTSTAGCVSAGIPATVTVFTTPSVSAVSGSICSGNSYTIVPTGAGAGGTYTIAGSNFTVTPSATTGYSIAGTSTAGCVSASANVNVTVNITPTITVNSGTICSGKQFTISPNGLTGGNYAVNGGNFTVSPLASTNYSVTGTSTAGCVSGQVISTVSVNTTPTITATSGSICAGGFYTIQPGGAPGGGTYSIAPGTSFTVNPALTTTYSVTGTATNGCVGATTAFATVTVFANPTISVNSGSICAGNVFTINPSISPNGTYTVTGGSFTVSPAANTSYSVTGTSTAGCAATSTAVASVTVNALPLVSVNTASAVCAGSTATFLANGATNYTWTTGSNTGTLTLALTSNTTIGVTGMDVNGCSNSASASVTVNTLPTINVASGAVCPGGTFTLAPSGAVTYTYSGGSATVSPSSTTSYTIIGTDANGCTSAFAAIATITVSSVLPVSISGVNVTCQGHAALLTAGGAATYSWSTGDGTSTISVAPATTTVYNVVGSSGSCSNTASFTLTVLSAPNVSATAASPSICIGESTMLNASGASTYTWVNTSQSAPGITVSPSATTIYTLVGMDANTCTRTVTVSLFVDICTGLASNKAEALLSVYPNPNNGEFNVSTPKALTISVYNTLGEVILTQSLHEGVNTVNLNDKAKGIYFIQAADGKNVRTIRMAVQ